MMQFKGENPFHTSSAFFNFENSVYTDIQDILLTILPGYQYNGALREDKNEVNTMAKPFIKEADLIRMTMENVRSFYNRDKSYTTAPMTDDFMWIGSEISPAVSRPQHLV